MIRIFNGRALAVLAVLLSPLAARGADPGAVDYAVRLQSSIQSNSNPMRASEGSGVGSSNLWVNTAGLAARIPLLSDDTRLDIAGMAGDTRFGQQSQLNYQPRRLDSTLHWRAGRLFIGQLNYQYQHERYESDRIQPQGDTVTTRHWGGAIGLRVTEDLTLPQVRLFDDRTRYGAFENQQLYDQNERGFEISADYQSPTGSSLSSGFRQSTSTFPLRSLPGTQDLDDKYVDREVFARVSWQYSVKTLLSARVGWLRREYSNRADPDVHLLTVDTGLDWQYSPKTQIRVGLWQRPYINDNEPAALYSMLRGGGLAVNWRMTPKVTLGAQGSYEMLKDKVSGQDDVLSTRARYGVRMMWQAWEGGAFVLDAYRSRQRGDQVWNRYQQNIVRVGLVIYLGSGNKAVDAMLVPGKCQWSYVEYDLCR